MQPTDGAPGLLLRIHGDAYSLKTTFHPNAAGRIGGLAHVPVPHFCTSALAHPGQACLRVLVGRLGLVAGGGGEGVLERMGKSG